jgi:hypothetical protein
MTPPGRNALVALLALLAALTMRAAPPLSCAPGAFTSPQLEALWPAADPSLSCLGQNKAIVFTPDLSPPETCDFYRRLGFACYRDASWEVVLDSLKRENEARPIGDRVTTVILETHGTNGNGLKLQDGHAPTDRRSYVSAGALQERLEAAGVRVCVISACNSGRLLRDEIYKTLDPDNGDRLFLPATLGVLNAATSFDPASSPVELLMRADSHLEALTEGEVGELAPATRAALGMRDPKSRFVISDLMTQMLTRDPRLELTAARVTRTLSRDDISDEEGELLFARFLEYLDCLAEKP